MCAVNLEKRDIGGGCRILRGRFSIPLAEDAIRLCAPFAEVGDNRHVPKRGRFAPAVQFGCGDRAFSRHGRGCASCRTAPLRSPGMCHRQPAHRVHEELRPIAHAFVLTDHERVGPPSGRLSRAKAAARQMCVLQNRRQKAVRRYRDRRRLEVLSTRHGARRTRCVTQRASRPGRAESGQPRDRGAAETARHCQEMARPLPPARRRAGPRAPKRLSVPGRTLAGHGRKQMPHLLLNSAVTSPSGLLAIIVS